jgi:hypothetical protein
MRRTLLAIALLPAVAATVVVRADAAAAAPAAARAAARLPRVAYFEVEFSATQTITWNENIDARACYGPGRVRLWGQGQSVARLQSPGPQLAVAKRTPRGGAAFWFGNRRSSMPVKGTLRRYGRMNGTP